MWFKITLLLATACAVHASLSPPQPKAPKTQLAGPRTMFEYVVLTWIFVGVDIYVTLSQSLPTPTTFCPRPSPNPSSLNVVSPLLLLGTLSTLCGAVLRKWCFATLGRLFTFEISIMPAHLLVTSGPYAYVRHPSYTGIFLTLGGATAVLGARGAWVRECGLLEGEGVVAWVCAVLWIMKCGYAMLSTARRGPIEDEQLRKQFGKVWEEYAGRVRYRLVPWLC
ncbi:hypothetical protein OF83DRAFT_1177928 [Amylostereum chailletii]|nr:hypothetical protein OF83DRAFT_1177928 [Amylostereum chailletii]